MSVWITYWFPNLFARPIANGDVVDFGEGFYLDWPVRLRCPLP